MDHEQLDKRLQDIQSLASRLDDSCWSKGTMRVYEQLCNEIAALRDDAWKDSLQEAAPCG